MGRRTDFREETTLVHVDIDPSALGRYAPIDIGIHGTAKTTAEHLSTVLAEDGIHREGDLYTDRLERRITEYDAYAHADFSEGSDAIDPRQLATRLEDILPQVRVVVIDSGHFHSWVYEQIEVQSPDP